MGEQEPETIMVDMTPQGVKDNPARVNQALEAFQSAQAELANYALRLIRDLQDGQIDKRQAGALLMEPEARELEERLSDAQEEFLRSLSGRAPARAAKARAAKEAL